jgi:hypothetical protein
MYMTVDYEPYCLAWDYNFFPFEDTLHDPAGDTSTPTCYKFVSLQHSSRVLIKFDRDEADC